MARNYPDRYTAYRSLAVAILTVGLATTAAAQPSTDIADVSAMNCTDGQVPITLSVDSVSVRGVGVDMIFDSSLIDLDANDPNFPTGCNFGTITSGCFTSQTRLCTNGTVSCTT